MLFVVKYEGMIDNHNIAKIYEYKMQYSEFKVGMAQQVILDYVVQGQE